jgi:hypothetical protein
VRRSLIGSYSPLYQAAYMLGALQIRALSQEVVASKKMTLKQFNDAFPREGPMPIEIMRPALSNQPLSPTTRHDGSSTATCPARPHARRKRGERHPALPFQSARLRLCIVT